MNRADLRKKAKELREAMVERMDMPELDVIESALLSVAREAYEDAADMLRAEYEREDSGGCLVSLEDRIRCCAKELEKK